MRNWILNHPARAGTIAGWYQQICSAAGAIVVIPAIMQRLPGDSAGLWFSFQNILALLYLFDFGLSFVMARQIAWAAGDNNNQVFAGGFMKIKGGVEGVNDIYCCARKVFQWLSLVSIPVAVLIYELILPLGKLLPHKSADTRSCWYLLALSVVVLLNTKPLLALLEGLSKVWFSRIAAGTFQLLVALMTISLVVISESLLALSLGLFCANVLYYLALRYSVDRWFFKAKVIKPSREGFKQLLKTATPIGFMHLSSFLVSSIQVPLAGSILGPAAVPGFYLAQKISQLLSQGIAQMSLPQLPIFTRELAAGLHSAALRRLRMLLVLTGSASLVAATAFYLLSTDIVGILVRNTQYIDKRTLAILAADCFLMTVSVGAAQFILASGRNPFVKSTFLAGAITVICSMVLTSAFGLTGLAASSLLAGLATNYWWAFYQLKSLTTTLKVNSPTYKQ